MPPLDEQQMPGQQQQAAAAAAATAVAVSCCGNFALVGNDAGRVDRYNLQSGIHRGTYWRKQSDGELWSWLFTATLGVAFAAMLSSCPTC
jgi:U3 small nucleolar RNA-associated protein 21